MAFYKEMNFNSFPIWPIKLWRCDSRRSTKAPASKRQHVSEITEDMLKGATRCSFWDTGSQLSCCADVIAVASRKWKEVFVTDLNTAVASEAFKMACGCINRKTFIWYKKQQKYPAHRFRFGARRCKYDVSLLAYLVDTNDIVKEISDVARRVDVTILASDEAVLWKGEKIQIPEDEEVWNQHLAAKVYTIAVAPERLLKRLEENEQTHLLLGNGIQWSDILARMEIPKGSVSIKNVLVERWVNGNLKHALKEIEQRNLRTS